MKDVQHEYTTIKGVVESVLDLTLNLKSLKLRKFSKEPEVVHLVAKGPREVTAKDLAYVRSWVAKYVRLARAYQVGK
jgi:DNA-directed RNA polymerase subunit alpha